MRIYADPYNPAFPGEHRPSPHHAERGARPQGHRPLPPFPPCQQEGRPRLHQGPGVAGPRHSDHCGGAQERQAGAGGQRASAALLARHQAGEQLVYEGQADGGGGSRAGQPGGGRWENVSE